MKKQILILFLSIASLYTTKAQYSHQLFTTPAAGSSSTYELSGGNVGIGTTIPAANLTIQGFGDGATAAEIIGTEVTSPGPPPSGRPLSFVSNIKANSFLVHNVYSGWGYPAADDHVLFVVRGENQNVGVGVASPNAMFHVINLNTSKPAFWVQSAGHTAIYADKLGNTGVGTTSPNTLLHVYGTQGGTDLFRVENNKTTAIYASSYGLVGVGTDIPGYQLDVNGDIHTYNNIIGDVNAAFGGNISVGGTATIGGTATVMGNINGSADAIISGKVVIGSVTAPSGYSLYVEKGVLADKYKCAVHGTSDWMDMVFEKSYKLTPLAEVETYIKANKHLPGVPSADEVVCDGIDMAKMDATLLKKIEELTLYMLEMKKENEAMKLEINNLKK